MKATKLGYKVQKWCQVSNNRLTWNMVILTVRSDHEASCALSGPKLYCSGMTNKCCVASAAFCMRDSLLNVKYLICLWLLDSRQSWCTLGAIASVVDLAGDGASVTGKEGGAEGSACEFYSEVEPLSSARMDLLVPKIFPNDTATTRSTTKYWRSNACGITLFTSTKSTSWAHSSTTYGRLCQIVSLEMLGNDGQIRLIFRTNVMCPLWHVRN